MKLAVIGAGGHAKVVIDAIEQVNAAKSPPLEVAGVVDDQKVGQVFCNYSVVGAIEDLDADCFVVAIGDNAVRARIFKQLCDKGYQPVSIVHPSAIIAANVVIGAGTVIFAGAIINTATTVGANCIVNTAASVDHDCIVDNHVHVAPGCHLAGQIKVGEGTFLGIGTKVIPLIILGKNVIAGAGAVIVRNVADNETVVGVPARAIVKAHLDNV